MSIQKNQKVKILRSNRFIQVVIVDDIDLARECFLVSWKEKDNKKG